MKIFHKYNYVWFLLEDKDDKKTVKEFIIDCVTYFLGEMFRTVKVNRCELDKMCEEICNNKQKAYVCKGLNDVRNVMAVFLKRGGLVEKVDDITDGREVQGISIYEGKDGFVDIHLEKQNYNIK